MHLRNASVSAMLPVVDLERAKKFYSETLELEEDTSMNMPGVAVYKAGKGTMLSLYQREATKADHTAACFDVMGIEEVIRELKETGVQFEEYDEPDFKTVGSIVTMGSGRCAWFKDTEGNILGLSEMR